MRLSYGLVFDNVLGYTQFGIIYDNTKHCLTFAWISMMLLFNDADAVVQLNCKKSVTLVVLRLLMIELMI